MEAILKSMHKNRTEGEESIIMATRMNQEMFDGLKLEVSPKHLLNIIIFPTSSTNDETVSGVMHSLV